MKRIILSIIIFCLTGFAEIIAQNSGDGKSTSYNNSEGLVKDLADPHVFRHEGTYYLYGTSDISSEGFKVYTSDDMIN